MIHHPIPCEPELALAIISDVTSEFPEVVLASLQHASDFDLIGELPAPGRP